ncbi:MAG: alpha/beta fold hydrolase [Chlorobia bacterium]|nr:alpha/beta fold hydrolase [Fimbriimonadaceae bacterium]
MLLLSPTASYAQHLVTATDNGILKAKEVQAKYRKFFAAAPAIKPVDIQLIKVRYLQGQDEKPSQVVSGLLAVPKNGAPKGIVIFYHGTLANRGNVPSRYRGEEKNAETAGPVLAFATAGYAVMMPDYRGLGDNKDVHPYFDMQTNSRAGIDMLDPAWFAAEQFKLKMGTGYYVSGYGQGGAAAMGATRTFEWAADESMRVVRSALLSGPYDLSGTQAKFLLRKSPNRAAMRERAFLAAYLARSLNHNGVRIRYRDYFVPSFADAIDPIFNQGLSDENTAKELFAKARQNDFAQPKFRKAIQIHDRRDPIVKALIEQDCFDWEMGSEIYMVCVEKDSVVSPENTRKAIREMRAKGVGPDGVRHHVLKGAKLDHRTGMAPALILARKFFDGGFKAVPSSG